MCGMALMTDQVETVAAGVGTPCIHCLLCRDGAPAQPVVSVGTYREWGWPVMLRRNQVQLTLGARVTALVLPEVLAEAVTAVLAGREHPAPALVNPEAPEEWVLLVGEPLGSRCLGHPPCAR